MKRMIGAIVSISMFFCGTSIAFAGNSAEPLNIALRDGMTSIGSAGYTQTGPEKAFDGDMNTNWFAKSPDGGRNVGIDAGEGNTITFNKIKLYEAADGSGKYRVSEYRIEVSDDAKTWTKVAEGTKIGEKGIEVTFKTQIARAVRFYCSKTSTGAPQIKEMEVYYEPEEVGFDKNLAINDSFIYIGSMESGEETGAYAAFDEDIGTYWEPDSSLLDGAYIGVDAGCGNKITFDAIKIKEATADYYRLKSFSVQISNDEQEYVESWTTISNDTVIAGANVILLPQTTARAVRVLINETIGGAARIAELEIYKTNYSSLNLGKGKSYSGTGTWSRTTIDKIFDDDRTTVWQPKATSGSIVIDAGGGKKFTFDTITISEAYNALVDGYSISNYRIQISEDMKTWYDLPDASGKGIGRFTALSMPAVTTRAIKLFVSTSNGRQPGIEEMGIHYLNIPEDDYGMFTSMLPGTRSYKKAEINEDFENVTNEDFIAEWITSMNKIGQRVSIYKESEQNSCIKLESCNANINTSAGIGFAALSGKFDIEFKMKQLRPSEFRMVMGSGESDKRRPETGRIAFQTTGYFSPLSNANLAKYNFGEWYRVKVSVDTDKAYFKAYLYNSDNRLIATSKNIATKADKVSSVIFSIETDTGCVLLDDVRVVTNSDTVKESVTLTPVIYGEAEKIRLYKSDTIEELDFSPEHIEESSFGGRSDMKLDATGFFRTEKINGRWWLIDPEGHPYFDRSLNEVLYESEDAVTAEKFSGSEEWMRWTKDFITEYGFTGMGNWSSEEINRESQYKMPYTVKVNTYGEYVSYKKERYPDSDINYNEIFPVFDADFESFADEHFSKLSGNRDDPYIIGYYTDNELVIGANASEKMLDKYLALDPTDEAKKGSYDAAWSWLKKQCGNDATTADITSTLRKKFKAYVFEKYYEVTTKYIKKYDPNHLILGTRHFSLSLSEKPMWEAAAKYVDVISANLYNAWSGGDLYTHLAAVDKPFIISEFYAKAEDSGSINSTGAGWRVYTQYDRGIYYQSLMQCLIENKNCVGAQWFLFKDDAGATQNSGVISQSYEPFTEPLCMMKEVNDGIYSLIDHIDSRAAGVVYTDAALVENEGEYLINPIEQIAEGMKVRASAIVNEGELIGACYDSEMNLLSCTFGKPLEGYGKLTSAVINIPEEQGEYIVKAFIWKDMVPLT